MTTSEERPGDVLSVVMAAIDDEDGTGGFATADILRVVRRALDPAPTCDEVTAALELLALPNIGGLRADGDGWQIAGPADVVARRLQFLAEAVADYRIGFAGHLDCY
ncbi:hypothetical protein F5X71_08465 [Nocardia brasiliensis]|uniref:Uncharacterized protein n=1 Tax=Nocardia brasiliensis TaxID=37326 RepID=A0A6G9XN26_NOCBR|nr:hypothetical protein [Nocardia brasiliensis]QIS02352.1 hypothetical protein F5X71_08465 [Nocardia brasiliensis]